ncbi:MAG: MFS transporter, partial [Alkalibacterium sp.]|nr:MFS transporter [Alkalibacterium sp.]
MKQAGVSFDSNNRAVIAEKDLAMRNIQHEETQCRKEKKFIESDAGDGSKREDQYLHGPRLALCFVAIFLCLFLVALDQTIIATLLTVVGNKFNGFDKIGWLSAGFLLSMAVFTATWGKISIIFGRKITMFIAVSLFEAGSLMCALANDMNVLIGGRVL